MEKNTNIPIKIGAIGGLDENGKNCFIIEVDNDIFVIEAGLKYPDKFTLGIDYIVPDFTYLKENAKRVKAVIVTHAHDDIYGSVPYLLNCLNIPCYLTSNTLTLMKADFESFCDFSKYDFRIVKPSDDITISGHLFHLFSTTHSAADSFGFALKTKLGYIVYTSDYITDYNGLKHYTFDFAKVSSIANERNTLMLLTDSSGADKPGICTPQHTLVPHIRTLLEDQKDRLFVALYTQNFYNIQELIDLVVLNNKKIVIVNDRLKDALPDINSTGNLLIPKSNYCEVDEMIRYAKKDIVILIAGSGEELFDIITEIANGTYIEPKVCLTNEDTLVLACPSVPGTETIATEALDACWQSGANVISLSRKEISSMHPHQEDLKMMISLFRPKYYMPVKGEYRMLMANAKLALNTGLGYNYMNTFIFDNGMLLGIDENGKVITNLPKIPEGSMMVTGNTVGEIRTEVLDQRTRLADDGIIILSAAVSAKQQKIVSLPEMQMRGFIYIKDQKNIAYETNKIFTDSLHELMAKKMMSTEEAEKKVADKLTKFYRKNINKSPYINVKIINIDENK